MRIRSTNLIATLCASWLASVFVASLPAAELIQLNEKNFDALCPSGKETDAIYGDWLLRNEHIVAVIAAPTAGRNANMTVKNVGAMVIDLTARKAPSDQLSCFYPAGSRYTFDDPATATVSRDGREVALTAQPRFEGRTLAITFSGRPVAGSESEARVTYTLRDGGITLDYRVELINRSDDAQDLPIQDLIRCDGPTYRFGQEEGSRLFWAEDHFFHQAYGILPERGNLVQAKDKRTLTLADSSEESKADAQIASGKSRIWSGQILCSQGLPGLRSMAEALAASKPTQDYQLKLMAADGPVDQAEIEVLAGDQTLGTVASDKEGWARIRLMPGKYSLRIQAPARAARTHQFELGASVLSESLTLDAAARVQCRVTDQTGRPIPAKLQFVGRQGTESPNFGPDTSDFAVRNVLYTANGTASHPLEPGEYAVIVSHGPEYDAVTETITVHAGRVAQVNVKLTRSVDTTGWVSGEFHSHSSPSGDNTSSQLGRVLNLLAENLEFCPCTEHNRIDTYDDHLAHLKAQQLMATCTGMELTGLPLPVNHQNAFPLHRHPHHQDGGGPTPDSDPIVQIQRLAMWDDSSDKVVQMNHPNLPQILGDRDLNDQPDEGFRQMLDYLDVVEIHPLQSIFTPPSADTPARERGTNRVFHWMQLLNLGYHIPGVVNTDAHYNWHGSGWLRNYIASSADDPAKISTEEMVAVVQAGNMVMTTAPFLQAELRANINGQDRKFLVGDHVPLGQAPAKLWVRVQCANWYDINRVQVFVNGRADEKLNFTRGSHPTMFGSSNVRFEAQIDLPKFDVDTHLIVTAIGEDLKLAEVMGGDRGALPPVAVANPIYVDVDGGKFKPNGDNLGVPFMLPEGAAVPAAKRQSAK